MLKVESMKEEALQQVKLEMELSRKFSEGYEDGFSDGYDKAIENVLNLANKYAYGKKENKEVELKPAVYFLHQPLGKLIDKVVEEVDEVVQAYNDGESIERIAEELADVQEASETAMAKLPLYVESKRRDTRLKVIEKNTIRGYYDLKEDDRN